jgi:rfaE bifunctional protein kinase chain/domain
VADALLRLTEGFVGRRVLVLGDVMLDRYWWGVVSRISPEAPVPVVLKERESLAPGGAANVAANIASLGGVPLLVGVVGNDGAADDLRKILSERGVAVDHLVTDPRRPTTVKTRVVAHSQHVVRVDEEDPSELDQRRAGEVAALVAGQVAAVDLVLVSDYAKGLLSPSLLRPVIEGARRHGRRVVVDPKGSDYSRYDGAYLLSPNRAEALSAAAVPAGDGDVRRAGMRLLEARAVDSVLVTQGAAGMTLFERGQEPVHVPALARSVFDVTGAGDTVAAVVALGVAAGGSLVDAVRLAAVAAGVAVEQVGTTAVTRTRLCEALREDIR